MDKNDEENIKKFRYAKRKMSVHYSIANKIKEKDYYSRNLSEEIPKRKKTRKKTMVEQEKSIKKLKQIYMKNKIGFTNEQQNDLSNYVEPELDYSLIQNFLLGAYDEEFQKILHILTSPYNERNVNEISHLLTFLVDNKIGETLRTDMLITELTIPELYQYFKKYIFGKMFNFLDTIYYAGEESNNLYAVLYGSIGQYRLEIYEEELTCEEYFIFLADSYILYEEAIEMGYFFPDEDNPYKEYTIKLKSILQDAIHQENKIINKNKNKIEKKLEKDKEKDKNKHEDKEQNNTNNKEEEKIEQYIDHYLICQMIDENKDIYPLKDISDLIRLKKIIFKLRLYMILNDSKIRDAELLYMNYEYPLTYLNFDKVIDGIIPVGKYVEILSLNFKQYDYFYLKLLGPIKHKVKLMKYVKCGDNLEPYSFFGNFELIDIDSKRDRTVRCESEKCILLGINKKMYSLAVYIAQKKKRDKELDSFHNCFLFRNISKKYFNKRVFSNFQIGCLFKGNVLFQHKEKLTQFFFIKEGIIELSLQNLSFYEFHRLINAVKEVLIKKAKEYKINVKALLDFNTDIESKTNFNMKTIRGILHQKQNFIFQRSEKGIFGDYELFFGLPALLTGTIISDKCLLYFYDYDNYKNLSYDAYLLNESLQYNSFMKLKSLLKRMIMVYNSYWTLSIEQLTKNLQEKEEIQLILNKEEEDKEFSKKSLFNYTNLNNTPFINTLQNYKSSEKNTNPISEISTFGRFNLFLKGSESNSHNNINNKNNFLNTLHNMKANNNISKNKIKNNITIYQNNDICELGKNPKINTIDETPSRKKFNDKYKNKILASYDNFNRKDFSVKKIMNNDIEKEFSNEVKNTNESDYQKKLFKCFKQTMIAQHVANKKEKKKIFLPPISYSSQKIFNEIIKTENSPHRSNKINNYKTKNINEIESPIQTKKNKYYIKTSLKNYNSLNLNDSKIFNNSSLAEKSIKSLNNSEINNNQLDSKIIKKKKRLYNGVKIFLHKKGEKKNKIMKNSDLKFAQLYNLLLRRDKKSNSLEKSFSSFS